MGNALKRTGNNHAAHYFLICDMCKFEVDIKTCLEESIYKAKNKWYSLKYNGKRVDYCNSCAVALEYIKSEGENDECKTDRVVKSVETMPAWN